MDASNVDAITSESFCNTSFTCSIEKVLGNHVQQKGSLVETNDYVLILRITAPLTKEELQQVETLINDQIRENHLAHIEVMPTEKALKSGAIALFGEKYGEAVRVFSLGNFSKELCGGTHVQRTGDIGLCKIISETGIASGVRRIEAVTGQYALEWIENHIQPLNQVAALLKSESTVVVEKLQQLLTEHRRLEKITEQLQTKLSNQLSNELIHQAKKIRDISILSTSVAVTDIKALRTTLDALKQLLSPAVIVLACIEADKVHLVCNIDAKEPSLHAGELTQFVAAQIGGKGGGRKEMAQGGGEPQHLEKALDSVFGWVEERARF